MINLNTLHNHSVERIIADIESLKDEIEDRAVDICVRLLALKQRKVTHPLMKDRFFRHYEAIATERVLPGLVGMFGGDKKYVDLFAGRSEACQKTVVGNAVELTVAVEKDGEIIEEKKLPSRLPYLALARLFPKGKPTATFEQQKAALLQEIASRPAPPPAVRYDAETGTIHFARRSFTWVELETLLQQHGLRLTAELSEETRKRAVA